MKVIENWRQAWKLFSVQIAALAVAFGALPPNVQAAVLAAVGIPAERLPAIVGLLLILSRIVAQPKAL